MSGLLHAALFLVVGVGCLFTDVGNVWLRAGLAMLMWAVALRTLAVRRYIQAPSQVPFALRASLAISAAAGALCLIGSGIFGGAIGWVGAFLSLRYTLTALSAHRLP
jgi:hypothetical protein